MKKLFFTTMAWSWLAFGALAVVIQLWRPGFVDYLMPIWVPFVVATASGLMSRNFK